MIGLTHYQERLNTALQVPLIAPLFNWTNVFQCFYTRAQFRRGGSCRRTIHVMIGSTGLSARSCRMSLERHLRMCAVAVPLLIFNGCPDTAWPPDRSAHHYQKGISLYHQGDYEAAGQALAKAARMDPDNPNIRYYLGLALAGANDTTRLHSAEAELERALQLSPDHSMAHGALSEVLLRLKRFDDARKHAEEQVRRFPQDANAVFRRAKIYLGQRDYANSITDLERAIKLDSHLVAAYETMSAVHEERQEPHEAESALRRALAARPEEAQVRENLGDLLLRHAKPAEARAEYISVLKSVGLTERVLLKLGQSLENLKEWQQADEVYRDLEQRYPANPEPTLRRAHMYLLTGKDEALDLYRSLADRLPNSLAVRDAYLDYLLRTWKVEEAERRINVLYEKSPRDPMGWFFGGRLKLMTGDVDRAVDLLQAVLRSDPNFAPAHLHLGMALMQRQEPALARRELHEAVRLAPESVEAHASLGTFYLIENDTVLAMAEAVKMSQLAPSASKTKTLLGDIYFRQHRLKEARGAFEELVQLKPNDPTARFRLGLVSKAQHNHKSALSNFEESLRLYPHAIEPLWEIVALLIEDGRAAEAFNRAKQQLAVSSENPFVHSVVGELALRLDDVKEGEQHLVEAARLVNTAAGKSLGLMALSRWTTLPKLNPLSSVRRTEHVSRLFSSHIRLGQLHEDRGERQEAEQRYHEILKVDATFPPALHGMARLLSDTDVDEALRYAEAAAAEGWENPRLADTLGWLYLKKGLTRRALTLLEGAAGRLPHDPTVQSHYRRALEQHATPRSTS
jgi:tetratricopeptide (TPR) repeat protein